MSASVVFLDRETIGPSVDLVRPSFDHAWTAYDRTAENEVDERIAGASVVMTNKVPIRGESLARAGANGLKLIQVTATGYDVIDIEAAKQAGVAVSNIRGYAAHTVPEHTFSLILALRRSLIGYRQDVKGGVWENAGQFCFFNHPIKDLSGSTIGIIGEGTIGRGVETIARAFGMRTWFADRKNDSGSVPDAVAFEKVIAESDIITLHCPLTPATRDLLAMPEFELMQRKPLIINTARGGLVNEADLLAALDRGLIGGFGFDTLVDEPPKAGNPLIGALDRPNVIVTPHVAWASDEAMQTLWNQAIDQIERFHRGGSYNNLW